MKKSSLRWIFSAALVLNTFLLRPAALGQQYVSVAMVLSLVLVTAYLLILGRGARVVSSSSRKDIMFVACLVTIYWLYEVPLSLTQRADDVLLAKDFFSSLVVVFCYAIFLMEDKTNNAFFRIFTTVVALLGWSSVVTLVLSGIVGLDHLYLFPVTVKGYDSAAIAGDSSTTGAVYFPFSMLYSVYTSGSLQLNRYSNFFREAGIYQAVSIFCFAYERFTRRSLFVTLGLVAGALSTLSTLGLVLLPITGGLVYVARRRLSILRIASLGVFGIVACLALVFTPAVGLADKLDTHGTSVTDRSDAMSRGAAAILSDPLGTGLFSEKESGDSICLIAAIAAIGVVGFLIQFALLSGYRPGAKINNPQAILCFPLMMTALVSQPIAGSGMTYVLVMASVPALVHRRKAELAQLPASRVAPKTAAPIL
ncbi:hypothetical protein AAHK20_27980 [Trinickia sp. YCB016]